MKMGKPFPWSPEDHIYIPELAPLFGGDPNVPAALLGKNCLITGETGSGKSKSFVIPLLKGLLRHRANDLNHRFALLVVDPKRELLDVVRSVIGDSERLVVLGEDGSPRVDFHEGSRDSLSVLEAFDQAIEALSPGSKKSTRSGGDNQYWATSGMALARQLVDLVAAIEASNNTVGELLARYDMWQDPPSPPAEKVHSPTQTFIRMADLVGGFFHPTDATLDAFKTRLFIAWPVIQRLVTSEQCSKNGVGPGVGIPDGRRDALRVVRLVRRMARSLRWPADATEEHLQSWIRLVGTDPDEIAKGLWNRHSLPNPFAQPVGRELLLHSFRSTYTAGESSWYAQPAGLLAGILASLRIGREKRFDAPSQECVAIGDALRRIARFVGRPDIAEALGNIGAGDTRTQFWHADIAVSILKPLLDKDVAMRLHLDPISSSPSTVSLQRCVEEGRVVVFQPKLLASDADDAFARTLKRQFFHATLGRANRDRGVAYIVDEAHRYLTVDEASWIDVCRAFRGITCLATQSIASLRLALAKQDHDLGASGVDAAVQVLVTNLANKAFFRSSDGATRDMLRSLIPSPPGVGTHHVIDVRGPATLRVGECWALTGDGGWSRHSIKLTESHEPTGAPREPESHPTPAPN